MPFKEATGASEAELRGQPGNSAAMGFMAAPKITMPSRTISLLTLAILLSAMISLGVLYATGFSAPYQDDYHAILNFSMEYLHSSSKLLTFAASQHNEYKLAFEHAVVVLELDATHHLNFALLTILGTLFLPLTGYLLWRMKLTAEDGLEQRLIAFLPICLLFFSLTYWESMDWAMATLQNLPVVFFSLLALQLLVRSTRTSGRVRFLFACVFGALAALTSANGFFLAPIGFCLLVWRKSAWRAAVWGMAFVVPFVAYLYRYQRSTEALGRHAMVKRAEFFIGFFGGMLPRPIPACFFGLVVIGVLVLAWRSGFARARPDVACMTAWLVMTDGVAAWVRGAANPGIPSRYSMYSLLFVIIGYSFLDWRVFSRARPMQRRRYYAWTIGLALVFWMGSLAGAYRKLEARRAMVLRGIALYRADPVHQSPMIDPAVDKMAPGERVEEQRILSDAIREGVYQLPALGRR